MLVPTHTVFGLFLTLILLAVFGIKASLHWTILVSAIIGAILPDIDHPRSFVGRLLSFISVPFERKFGHRTASHSLIGWGVATFLGGILIGLGVFLAKTILPHQAHTLFLPHTFSTIARLTAAFSIGYFSHIILDMVNPRGVQLFWPESSRDVIFSDAKLRPESGSKAEIPVFIFFAIMLIFAFPISKYGFMPSFRWFLATPEAAMEEFKTSRTKTLVKFDGVWKDTREPVSGQAEILDVHNKRLVVRLLGPRGGIYTLSDELTADILAEQARVLKTEIPIRSRHKTFQDQTWEALLVQLPSKGLISGAIELPKDLRLIIPKSNSSIPPITQHENRLVLAFATKKNLVVLRPDAAFQLKQKADHIHLHQLEVAEHQTTTQLQALESPNDGLTALGRAVLNTKEKEDARLNKRDELTHKLEQLGLEKEEVSLRLKANQLRFSGEVRIRD